jgi:anti-sigma B factor antagonist
MYRLGRFGFEVGLIREIGWGAEGRRRDWAGYSECTMALEIRQREAEGILIADLKGRLVMGADSTDLRSAVNGMVARGEVRTILNLKEIDYIDSTGLGSLVIAHAAFEKAGGGMKLLHLSKRSAELLILTKLSTVFEMYDDEQAAINSFFPDREVRRFDILEFVKSQEEKPMRLGTEGGAKPREA